MSTNSSIKTDTKLAQTSALALATGLMFAASPAQAQSFEGTGNVVEGSATITTSPGATDITVESTSAVIDWTPTDNQIGGGDILFQQNGTTATFISDIGLVDFAVLNRILPADANRRVILDGNIVSIIQDGIGQSTGGTVWFYTPGGIIIGQNAVIDVGNLGLTTAAPVTDGNGNFIDANGTVQFQQAASNSSISIAPGAIIDALSEGSYVAAFAPQISNSGDIRVNGQAALVAGEAGSITFSPDGLFDIQVTIGSDSSLPIINQGSITGPAATGPGDNHRIYMVAIPKNQAMTMLIDGGSDLGFDIATEASADGETIILSAGYNITVGEVDSTPQGNAEASIQVSNNGNLTSISSDVVGHATGSANLFAANGDIILQGDLTFHAGSVDIFLSDFGQGAGNIVANGDLTLIADTPAFGVDIGGANATLNNGAGLFVAGDFTLASRATEDFDQDGSVIAGSAIINASSGATLSVGGNLLLESIADASEAPAGTEAQTQAAELLIDPGAMGSVGGVTRIRNEAYGAAGGSAFGSNALISVFEGTFTTGELNVFAIAVGGDDFIGGSGGGNATSGVATVGVGSTNSNLTVLGGNTIGDASAGDLDFVSSVAIGGEGVEGNGGDAFSGDARLLVNDGTITLPDDPALPLLIRSQAIGGSTSEDDGAGGNAFAGTTFIEMINSTGDLGRLAIDSQAMGGSALQSAERTSGGVASGVNGFIQIFNSDVQVAFDEINFGAFGGNGSGDVGGDGGSANPGNVTLIIEDSNVDVGSDFNIDLFASGGTGNIGGDATTFSSNSGIINSTLNVQGNFELLMEAMGGFGIVQGGNAFNQFGGMLFRNSTVTASGTIRNQMDVTGGDVQSGQGGNANSFSMVINVDGQTVVNAEAVEIFSFARGGSNISPGTGNGGNAISNGARLDAPNFGSPGPLSTTINADVLLLSQANGGDAGSAGGNGGEANGGLVQLFNDQGSTLTINGSFDAAAFAVGGEAPSGTGGTAFTGSTQLISFGTGSDVLITGDLGLFAEATGGVGQTGGDATAADAFVLVRGSTLTVDGAATLSATVTGGNATESATGGAGGNASNSSARLFAQNNIGGTPTNVNLGSLTVINTATGGDGGNSTAGNDGGAGGNAQNGGTLLFANAQNGNLNVTGATQINLTSIGGAGGSGANGGAGGNATNGFANFGTASGGSLANETVEGSATFSTINLNVLTTGGDGGTGNDTGGDGGDADGFAQTLLVRGAPVTANSATLVSNTTGGAGGDGDTLGDGGDATAGSLGLLVSQAFENPGRGAIDLGSLLIDSNVTGGTGANAGTAFLPAGGGFTIIQSDASIGSVDISEEGDVAPMGAVPFEAIFTNATLDNDTFTLTTPGEVNLTSDEFSDISSRIFTIAAGSFVLPDLAMPTPNPGTIGASEALTLTATDGGAGANALLRSDGTLIVTAAQGIALRDITGADVQLTAQNGRIDLFSIGRTDLFPMSPSGSILLSSSGDIATGIVEGQSIVMTSTNGSITALPTAADNVDITAQGDIDAGNVDANTVNLVSTTGSITAGTITATDITLSALGGAIEAQILSAIGTLFLESLGTLTLTDIDANSLIARSLNGGINSNGTLDVNGAAIFEAQGGIVLEDVFAGTVTATSNAGSVTADNITASDITLRALGGMIDASFLNASGGTITLESSSILFLPQFNADSLFATGSAVGGFDPINVTGDIVITTTGGNTILSDITADTITVNASGNSQVGNFDANEIAISIDGSLTSGFLNANDGTLTLETTADLMLQDLNAGSLIARSTGGSILANDPISVAGNASFDAAFDVILSDVDAGTIQILAGGLARADGQWQAGDINVTSSFFDIDIDSDVNANSFTFTSINEEGLFIADTDNGNSEGSVIDQEVYERINAGDITFFVAGTDNGTGELTVGDFNIAANESVENLTFATSGAGSIFVDGVISAAAGSDPINLTLTTGTLLIDTTAGGIDLFDNGGLLSIFASSIGVGERDLFENLSGDETEEELADILNAPATNGRPEGTVRASEIVIGGAEVVLIQNSGTEETPAGFVVAGIDNLTIEPFDGEIALVIINGQVDDGAGNVLTGDDAATAIIENADDLTLFAPGSQLNGCELGGCVVATGGSGEATAAVSASVNGAVGASGTGSGGGSGSGSGSSSGDSSDGGSASNSGANAGGSAGSSGSDGGGDTSVDDVDDGGDEDFAVEEDEGSGEESEGEESEEESEEEESSEEEEEAEAAATGPIAPPVTIFNTSSLERPVTINDPISGSGNPALTDPDVDTPPAGNNGDQP